MQRAAQRREERQYQQALDRLAASDTREDRHLPTCACAQCKGQVPSPVPSTLSRRLSSEPLEGSPAFTASPAHAHAPRPQWTNDFTEEARGGFDQLYRRGQLEERRRQRKVQKQQQQRELQERRQPEELEPPQEPYGQQYDALAAAPFWSDGQDEVPEPYPTEDFNMDSEADPYAGYAADLASEHSPDGTRYGRPEGLDVGSRQRSYSASYSDTRPRAPPALVVAPAGPSPAHPAQKRSRRAEVDRRTPAPSRGPTRPHGPKARSSSVPHPRPPKGTDVEDRGPSTRVNFDKRTSRMQHRDEFMATIAESTFLSKVPTGQLPPSAVHIFVRKRPLFAHEREKGEYDVVQVDPAKCRSVIHTCLMHPDLQRMYLQHVSFPSTRAFPETSQNREVYAQTAQPLLLRVAEGKGAVVLLLMYGQTGSGKTYTMSAIEELSARELFTAIAPQRGPVLCVMVTVLEIAGKTGRDLLSPSRSEVTFVDLGDGGVQVQGAVEANPRSAEELLHVFAEAKRRRATESTAINATSSRSHCITTVYLVRQDQVAGRLVLVDCAGSERKEDSAHHTAERRREGAEINASIYALKECMRAMTSGARHVPFRNHLLTRALKDNFTTPGAEVAVIATCSPTATDTEHSLGTLRTVCGWRGVEDWITTKKEDVLSRRQRDRNAAPDPAHFQCLARAATTEQRAERVEQRAADWMQKRKALIDQRQAQAQAQQQQAAKPRTTRPNPTPAAAAAPYPPRRPPPREDGISPRPRPSTPKGKAGAAAARLARSGGGGEGRVDDVAGGLVQGMTYMRPEGGAHPKTWNPEQANRWVHARCHRRLPDGVDGKTLLRWNLSKCTGFCEGDERAGLVLFNGLRLEVDYHAAQEKERRANIRRHGARDLR